MADHDLTASPIVLGKPVVGKITGTPVAFVENVTGAGGNPTSTKTDVDFGEPHEDRWIVLAIATYRNQTGLAALGSVKINGASASEVEATNENGDEQVGAAIYKAHVPTGETGEIELNFGADVMNYRISVFRVIGEPTFSDRTVDNGTGTTLDLDTDTLAGEFLVAAGAFGGSSDVESTGLDTETYNDDERLIGYRYPTTAESPRTVTIDFQGGSQEMAGVAASLAITPISNPTAITQIYNFTTDPLTLAAPVLASPALSQVHGLTADPLTLAAPVLDAPAAITIHPVVADPIALAAPVLASPAIEVLHLFVADPITVGPVTLDAAAVSQVHALVAEAVTIGAPVLDSPVLVRVYTLTADPIALAAIALDSPAALHIHPVVADPIALAAPVLDSPAVSQVHALVADALVVGPVAVGPARLAGFAGILVRSAGVWGPRRTYGKLGGVWYEITGGAWRKTNGEWTPL